MSQRERRQRRKQPRRAPPSTRGIGTIPLVSLSITAVCAWVGSHDFVRQLIEQGLNCVGNQCWEAWWYVAHSPKILYGLQVFALTLVMLAVFLLAFLIIAGYIAQMVIWFFRGVYSTRWARAFAIALSPQRLYHISRDALDGFKRRRAIGRQALEHFARSPMWIYWTAVASPELASWTQAVTTIGVLLLVLMRLILKTPSWLHKIYEIMSKALEFTCLGWVSAVRLVWCLPLFVVVRILKFLKLRVALCMLYAAETLTRQTESWADRVWSHHLRALDEGEAVCAHVALLNGVALLMTMVPCARAIGTLVAAFLLGEFGQAGPIISESYSHTRTRLAIAGQLLRILPRFVARALQRNFVATKVKVSRRILMLQLAWFIVAGITHNSLEMVSGPHWAMLLAIASRSPMSVLAASRAWSCVCWVTAPTLASQCSLVALATGIHLPPRICRCLSAAIAWTLANGNERANGAAALYMASAFWYPSFPDDGPVDVDMGFERTEWQSGAGAGEPAHANRGDVEMKLLLETLTEPHFVRRSRTHGQNNCLIDSVLLSLQAGGHLRRLTRAERASICASARAHLEEQHGVPPISGNGVYPYLSHEDHFDPICTHLRQVPDIWDPAITPDQLGP